MAYLFIINSDRNVFPNPETLLIEPFKTIWERDNSKGKEKALEELAYIEFIGSVKKSNPYKGYPENVKESKVRAAVITDDDWQPDEFIVEGINKIIEFQQRASATYNYYMSAKKAAEKMQDFFNNFDINDVNEKTGNPKYKPRDITSALNDTEKIVTNLSSINKKVEEEIFEEVRNKGNKEISPFAKLDNLD